MTVARTYAATLVGVAGHVVEVEADLSNGLPGITFTGLPDTTVVEARDRVRAAVVNSGAPWPNRKITLALLPADLRKHGSRFDLSIGALRRAYMFVTRARPPAAGTPGTTGDYDPAARASRPELATPPVPPNMRFG